MKRARIINCLVASFDRPHSIFVFILRPEPGRPEEGRILIIDPSAESTLRTKDVTISTFVDYFTLVDKTGQTAIPGEGHIIYYLDVTPPWKKASLPPPLREAS